MGLLGGFLHRIGAHVQRQAPARHPCIVRRTTLHCPHGGGAVDVDLVMGCSSRPHHVLRCSARGDCPPACDQACRLLGEAVSGRPLALLILPSGSTDPHEID